MSVKDISFVICIAFAASWLLTPLWRTLARRFGFVASPGPRRIHTRPTPTGGGIVIYVAVWASFLVFHGFNPAIIGPFIASTLVVVLGLIDDYIDLKPGVKLFGQVVAAGVFVAFGPTIQEVANPWGAPILLGSWGVPVTMVWLVAMTNTLNIIDGLDGLAAGITAIAAVPLLVLSLFQGQAGAALLAAGLVGAAGGFLPHNFYPARLFMGDAGGLFLGFMLGAVAVQGVLQGPTTVALTIPILIFGIPIFDTLCAVLRRALNGRPIARADDMHVHHRLLHTGLSHRRAVLFLYWLAAILGTVGVVMGSFGSGVAYIVPVVLFVIAFPWARRLGVLHYARHGPTTIAEGVPTGGTVRPKTGPPIVPR